MTKKISTAEAKAKFSSLVAEVAFGGRPVVIEKRGKALAALISIKELDYLEKGHAFLLHPAGALSVVGAWKEISEEEMDNLIANIYENRQKDTGRPVSMEA